MNQVIDRQEELWYLVRANGLSDDRILRLKQIIHPCFSYDISPDNNRYGRPYDTIGNMNRLGEYTRGGLGDDVDEYEDILASLFVNTGSQIYEAMTTLVNQYVVFCEGTNATLHTSTTNDNDSDSD